MKPQHRYQHGQQGALELLESLEAGPLSRRQLAALALGGIGAAALPKAAVSQTPSQEADPLFQTTELNHIALRVTDLERSERFYREILGLKTLRKLRTVRFMQCGPHFVALFQSNSPGIDHLSLSWPEYSQAEAVRRLEAAGLEAETQEERTYFRDPDGIQLQLAWNEDWPGSEPRPDR